ncbi:MAG TPA: non-homologous end-joining DNA ligase [Actinomycetota bacterium]|nr:non-homologous end-joining DNA ligase [Actinomycetota bacterium]
MPRRRDAFTVPTPVPLPAEREGEHWWIEVSNQRVRLSNLDKVYWPEEGFTKGDLLAYYYNVADVILPYLADRPLTMKRMPDGVGGSHFYEKNAPSHTPDWMPRCRVESEEDEAGMGYNDFLMANSVAGLLFVANLGAIEFHPLHSRCGTIERPDYLFFDLDPMGAATFDDVLAVAQHVRAALGALNLPAYPKTSGATGLQIYVPLADALGYDAVRSFVGTVGQAIRRADPDRVTMTWDTRKRGAKIFIDHNMNRRGANISAVYSVRPEPGASVSTPLTWEEIERGDISPRDFTMENIHERLAEVGDLFRPVLDDPVHVREAMRAVGVDPGPEPATDEGRSLAEYERKRDFGGTPEPPPAIPDRPGNSFVIQKHDATRLHYDLRLERGGVLVSWAVPKGLPLEPGERRLAVQTEDHPLDYGSFEGWIPEGHYGAGEVKIYDRGTYEPIEWRHDKVTFRLHGERHRGEYHLVKTRENWLVFLSRRSAEEQASGAPDLRPMLAEPWPEPFDDERWRFEPKLDGIRALAYIRTDGTRLVSRTGRDQTAQYPELANLARFVNARDAVIDGEIVALDEEGRPSFERLQQRMNLTSPRDVERARRDVPVLLYAFDVLWVDGRDLTGEPLEERRAELERIATEIGVLRLTTVIDGRGTDLFAAAKDLGFEGILAKRLGSRYAPGRRSKEWRKIKAVNRQDCVILGWTRGEGARSSTFGSLLVGAYRREEGDLVWIGQVGTGFTAALLDDLLARLRSIESDDPPIEDRSLRAVKGARWVRPELVCDVEYLQMTKAGKLRAPSFKGLRPDKRPSECLLEPPAPS